MTLQTIGARAAETERKTDSDKAYRWTCPLTSCGGERSPLYGDETQTTSSFEGHIRSHSIEQAIEFLKTSKWLSAFALVEA